MISKIRISSNEKIGMVGNIATMLSAGIPLSESVESLLEDSKGNLRKIMEQLLRDLTAGKHIYESLKNFPKVFDNVSVNLIKASETAGTLETTLKDIKKNLQEEAEFADKVKSALFYPVVVSVVFFGVLMVMLLFVVPQISATFGRMDLELPFLSRALFWLSATLINNWVIILISTIIIIIFIIMFFRTFQEIIVKFAMLVPVFSKLMIQIDISRFTRSLHLLLASGIPIGTALDLAQEVIMIKELREVVITAKKKAISGHKLTEGLKLKKSLFPGIVLKLMEVGEKTGTLEKSMQDVSDFMDYEVTKLLKKLTSMLEPLMLVVIGIAVGILMMAIIQPIYGLMGGVKM